MSVQADGSYVCDRCGADCGNGGVYDSVVVADLNTDTGLVVNFNFCRDRSDGNGKVIKGCDTKVLTRGTLANWLAAREMSSLYPQPIKEHPDDPEEGATPSSSPETPTEESSSQTPATSSDTSTSS